MPEIQSEVHRIPCPQCSFQLDPVEIAKQLPLEVLVSERARRTFKMRRRQAGPGRPKGVADCPSCLRRFSLEKFRAHLLPCLTTALQRLQTSNQYVQVRPMDPTKYRDFRVTEVRNEIVVLEKLSSGHSVEIPLRAIREITPSVNGEAAVMTLRGCLRWKEDLPIPGWRYSTE